MKRVFAHLKGYALESVLAPLFKLLEAGFELIVPLRDRRHYRQGYSRRRGWLHR